MQVIDLRRVTCIPFQEGLHQKNDMVHNKNFSFIGSNEKIKGT
jgi:hypothetical protein